MDRLQKIFLSSDLNIVSPNKLKRAILTGFLALLTTFIGALYLVYNRISQVEDVISIYYALMLSGLLAYGLNRFGYHTVAKLIVLIMGDTAVFLFSTKAAFQADTHFYYIILCLSAFSLFGYEHRWFALGFSFFTIVLFWISFKTGYSPLPPANYPPDYVKANQIINFVVASLGACVILYFLVRLNYVSEDALNKKQEEITARNSALIKANAELDRFVYSASHDLRAPLTSMLGLIMIAQKSKSPEEIDEILDRLKTRVHQLDIFIHEIIDISRNSRLEIEKKNINVQRLIQEVAEQLQYLKTESTDLQLNIDPDLVISTDVSRLKVIVSNLLGNALKYIDHAKAKQQVVLEAYHSHNTFILSVTDNGLGIDPQYHEKIFSMFFRAHDESQGSGLGLYIVKEAIEKLGGNIILHSSPGQGSTFTVHLPD